MKKLAYMLSSVIAFGLMGCSNSNFEKQLTETLEKKPELLFQVIEKNPDKFMQTVQAAARKARPPQQQGDDPRKMQEEEFKNPKQPQVDENRILGKKDAPVLIVEYSDLECPFCGRGSQTLSEVKQAYGDKVKIIFKHLPLPMHPQARPAALYYEAIAKDSQTKAYDWAKLVFQNQQQMRGNAQKLFDDMAKKAGVNVAKVKKTLADKDFQAKANAKISADMDEARKFGIQGTPGFVINGVTIKGAYPLPAFKDIIDRHLGEKKN